VAPKSTTTNPGVPGATNATDAYATTTNTTTATTGWYLVSMSITEEDIKRFIEQVRNTDSVVHLVIEKYMTPALSAYQQIRSVAIFWFNGEQLVPLGTQFTPIEPEALFVARQIEDYPRVKNEVLNKWGISLDAYVTVTPEPGNPIIARFGPEYCPDMNTECLIKHIPHLIYRNCAPDGKPTEDPQAMLLILMSDANKMACANEAMQGIRFLVKVDLEAILSNLRDLAVMVLSFNEAVQLPPRLSLMLDAYAMGALNKIDNIMSKRAGMAFMLPPAMVVSMVRDAYNSVSSLVQTLTSAIMARQAIKAP